MWIRVALTIVTYLVSLALVATFTFFVVIFLAGPHSGLLPGWAESIVAVSGWLAVLLVPVWAARKVWRWRAPAG